MLKKGVDQKTGCLSIQKKAQSFSFSQGSFVVVLIFNLFKVIKITINLFDLLKVSKVTIFFYLSKVSKNVWVKVIKSKMPYSESELVSNFAINSVSDFNTTSESESKSVSNSVFMNLDIYIFFTLYLHSSK